MKAIDYNYEMNFRDLQYLVSVEEHLHFGKAAEACHVSQPTLSMQLKKLEETLGVQLFERTSKQVMITEPGRQIAFRARQALAEADAILQYARMAKDPLAGALSVGVFPTLAPYILPRMVEETHRHFPRVDLQLREEKSDEILTLLEQGKLDCALLAMPVSRDSLEFTALFEEPFLLAVSTRHPLAKRKRVRLGDLQTEKMLLLDDGHCLRDQVLDLCNAIGIGEARRFRATSLETLRHMVAASDHVTLMPRLAIGRPDPAIRYIPFAPPVPSRFIALVWRRSSARKTLFMKLADVLRA